MPKRKQYIIDKKFQLKQTFYIIGFVGIITAILLTVITVNVVLNNRKIENIYVIENRVVDFLTGHEISSANEVYRNAIKKAGLSHTSNMNRLTSIMEDNNLLLAALLILIISQGILLYILMIRRTHKISGPIYVMTKYLRLLKEGKYPQTRPLRSSDELQEFYNLFVEHIEELKEKDKS